MDSTFILLEYKLLACVDRSTCINYMHMCSRTRNPFSVYLYLHVHTCLVSQFACLSLSFEPVHQETLVQLRDLLTCTLPGIVYGFNYECH